MKLKGITLIVIAACATPSKGPEVREIRCGDLARLEFYFTQPSVGYTGSPVSPWKSSELVWVGESAGLTGADLLRLRVLEAPQRIFSSGEAGLMASKERPLLTTIEFTFSPSGGERFRQLERTLDAERSNDLLRSRGLAILLNGDLFLHLSMGGPSVEVEPEVLRTIQLRRTTVDEISSLIEDKIGCT